MPRKTLAATILCLACASCQKASTSASVHSQVQALEQAAAKPAAASEVKRVLLSHEDLPELPGYESRLYLIEFPPGAQSKPHIHPTPGLGYVLEGRFESSYDDGSVTVTKAGESFTDLPDRTHHFRNPDPEHTLRFVVSGTYRKDQELFRLAP